MVNYVDFVKSRTIVNEMNYVKRRSRELKGSLINLKKKQYRYYGLSYIDRVSCIVRYTSP